MRLILRLGFSDIVIPNPEIFMELVVKRSNYKHHPICLSKDTYSSSVFPNLQTENI
jgi:hypothetical protein